MAINREKEKSGTGLPSRLADMLLRGFTFQALRDQYDSAFTDTKGEVKGYLEKNDDDFNVDMGKGFKCDQGSVCYKSTTRYDIDKDKLTELVKSGKVTIETIMSIANFGADNLKKALGEAAFSTLATPKTSESLAFTATPDFKASVADKFGGMTDPEPVDVKKELKAIPEEAKPEKKESAKDSVARIKAASKGKAKATKEADDELDAILGKK